MLAREEEVQKVPLWVRPNTTATRVYYLSAQSEAWQSQAMPMLYDKKLNYLHNLNQGPYAFTMDPQEAQDRFELRFDVVPMATAETSQLAPPLMWAKDGNLHVQNAAGGTLDITIVALSGQVLAHTTTTNQEWTWNLPAKGLYLVQWTRNGQSGVQKVLY
jgi:hypothetical protein